MQADTLSCAINRKQYTYDALERVIGITTVTNTPVTYTESFTYISNDTNTSSLVATHTVGGVVYSYTYDNLGNITVVKVNGNVKYRYSYDRLGQLILEQVYSDNGDVDAYEYLYDASGNITWKNHHYGEGYIYTDSITYSYGNATWGDLLTNYNGTAITYDAIGNPLKWRNAFMLEWQGRNLITFAHSNGEIYNYTYNADGIRTSKIINDANGNPAGTVKYTLDGSKIVAENRLGTKIYYTYDDKGAIMGMVYGGYSYVFSKNVQGDVIGIYNESRQLVAKYEYSAFGEITSVIDLNGSGIASINPFRYRGYYYDTETGFYYLQSRYYDPVVGRFINRDTSDVLTATPTSLTDKNLYAYCDNNPVIRVDGNGLFWDTLLDVCSFVSSVIDVCKNPTDPMAWASLAGDTVDLIPFVTAVGETVKVFKAANKVVDAAHDTSKTASKVIETAKSVYNASDTASDLRKATGSYEIIYESGNTYVGKGGFKRAISSAERNATKYGDDVISISWKKAPNHRAAFIEEYKSMCKYGGPQSYGNSNTYNKIWSPGRKYFFEDNGYYIDPKK